MLTEGFFSSFLALTKFKFKLTFPAICFVMILNDIKMRIKVENQTSEHPVYKLKKLNSNLAAIRNVIKHLVNALRRSNEILRLKT